MKRAIFYWIFILVTLLSGCQQKTFVGKGKYGLEFKYECVLPPGEPLMEIQGGNIFIIDTLLLVHNMYGSPSHHWDLFSLRNLQHIKSILINGRGPKEVLSAHYTNQYENIDGESWIYFQDINSLKFYKLNLDRSIAMGDDVIESVSSLERGMIALFSLGDETFLYDEYNKTEKNLYIMKGDNSWDNPVVKRLVYKGIEHEDYLLVRPSVYFNKRGSKACVIPTYVDHIQLIDLEGNNDMILSTAKFSDIPTFTDQEFTETVKVFYSNLRITEEYFFVYYENRTLSEMMEGSSKESEIHVFSWDGEAVARIKMTDYITTFAIDESNWILYGLDNQGRIFKYDISHCLKSNGPLSQRGQRSDK